MHARRDTWLRPLCSGGSPGRRTRDLHVLPGQLDPIQLAAPQRRARGRVHSKLIRGSTLSTAAIAGCFSRVWVPRLLDEDCPVHYSRRTLKLASSLSHRLMPLPTRLASLISRRQVLSCAPIPLARSLCFCFCLPAVVTFSSLPTFFRTCIPSIRSIIQSRAVSLVCSAGHVKQ